MKTKNFIAFALKTTLMIMAFSLLSTSVCLASSHAGDEATAADVKKEAAETYQALKDYTLEQRDEAVAMAREKIDQLDRHVDRLEQDMETRWQEMSQASREKTRQTLKQLQKQREEVAEWLGGMRHSSGEAWEDVKQGFADSYAQLEQAFDDAKSRFAEENAK